MAWFKEESGKWKVTKLAGAGLLIGLLLFFFAFTVFTEPSVKIVEVKVIPVETEKTTVINNYYSVEAGDDSIPLDKQLCYLGKGTENSILICPSG